MLKKNIFLNTRLYKQVQDLSNKVDKLSCKFGELIYLVQFEKCDECWEDRINKLNEERKSIRNDQ